VNIALIWAGPYLLSLVPRLHEIVESNAADRQGIPGFPWLLSGWVIFSAYGSVLFPIMMARKYKATIRETARGLLDRPLWQVLLGWAGSVIWSATMVALLASCVAGVPAIVLAGLWYILVSYNHAAPIFVALTGIGMASMWPMWMTWAWLDSMPDKPESVPNDETPQYPHLGELRHDDALSVARDVDMPVIYTPTIGGPDRTAFPPQQDYDDSYLCALAKEPTQ
jgi:hypothetical protein